MIKILVTTIPSWNQSTGANTFASLLELIKTNEIEIANLFTRADLPDSDVADRYFQILEGNVVRSIINRKIKTGREVSKVKTVPKTEDLKKETKRYALFTKYRWNIFLWGREILWKLGRWNSKELDIFLEDYNPDIIMFPIESYLYFNRINNYIITKCSAKKIIGYLWDDNFTYKQSNGVSHYISRYFTRKSVNDLVKSCDEILTICPKMKEECDEEFGINSTLITKPIRSNLNKKYVFDKSKPIRMIYTGGLYIGRSESLISLAKAIQKVNKNRQRIYLDIYTSTVLKTNVYKALNIPNCSSIKGSIPQSQVFLEQENSDILVFAESFENKIARLSFSTKITDYLSSKRCILAIGPSDISSIEYLKNEDAALICCSEEDIFRQIENIVNNTNIIEEYAEKGFSCGVHNHNKDTISEKINSLIKI